MHVSPRFSLRTGTQKSRFLVSEFFVSIFFFFFVWIILILFRTRAMHTHTRTLSYNYLCLVYFLSVLLILSFFLSRTLALVCSLIVNYFLKRTKCRSRTIGEQEREEIGMRSHGDRRSGDLFSFFSTKAYGSRRVHRSTSRRHPVRLFGFISSCSIVSLS